MNKNLIGIFNATKNQLKQYFLNSDKSEFDTYPKLLSAINTICFGGKFNKIEVSNMEYSSGQLVATLSCATESITLRLDYGSCEIDDALEYALSKGNMRALLLLCLHIFQNMGREQYVTMYDVCCELYPDNKSFFDFFQDNTIDISKDYEISIEKQVVEEADEWWDGICHYTITLDGVGEITQIDTDNKYSLDSILQDIENMQYLGVRIININYN